MLSKSKTQYIRSLEHKKFRTIHQSFVVEGEKAVGTMLPHYECLMLLALPSWIGRNDKLTVGELISLDSHSLARLSFMPSPPDVIAVFRLPRFDITRINPKQNLVLALDGVQDPGNLGAIVRLADWFGIEDIVCSPDCADGFSPKAVQAAMGSIARVQVHYTSLPEFFGHAPADLDIFGTYLNAGSIYEHPLASAGIILMGSEGNGIRPDAGAFVNRRISIPFCTNSPPAAESLNVAMATAIVCAEFRRR